MSFRHVFLSVISCLALVICGCEYVPEGATLYKIQGKKEFDQAFIHFPPREGQPKTPLRLRWVDTNTWMTTASLDSGSHRFAARTVDGSGAYAHQFEAKPGQRKYEFPAQSGPVDAGAAAPASAGEPLLTARLSLADNAALVRQVAVVFFGKDVTVQKTHLQQGKLSINAPVAGKYRVAIYSVNPETSAMWTSEPMDLSAPRDLGNVQLK